jgi:N-glycosylase/DNA lyase
LQVSLRPPPGFDLVATARSHGWYDLPPFAYDHTQKVLARVLDLGGRAVDCAISVERDALRVRTTAEIPRDRLRAQVAAMLRLDEDLTSFYDLTDRDPKLAYARRRGAGRLLRAPTVFEDVIKMLLTTNCSWSFTRLMVSRLVERLGVPSPSGARAFPTPEAMAEEPERFYRDEIRAGYRAPHLLSIARDQAAGKLDLERLRDEPDAERLRDELLALPGIGPYAADNLLRLLGGYGYLGLDSWCRGKLKKLYPRTRDPDALARRLYRPYGHWQGLAMWLDLTRDWHESPDDPLAA